ncbi:MAG: hypothetical protein HYR56_22275 [Acidobacteria bacterium]|nr:hypothetical protein [Acidobacteriota bacterium]MBI3426638.1 hypothetical protein [Acidobacteriota bacterium]
MRRKVIQDFANTFCQKFLDLPNGYDVARFAKYEKGTVILNIITGACLLNGVSVPTFSTCDDYRLWLQKQLETHHISENAIMAAKLTVQFLVSDIKIEMSFGHIFRSADFEFHCASEIQTDEKAYVSQMSHRQKWAYGYYWDKLHDGNAAG